MEEILKNSTELSNCARMCLNFCTRGSKEGNSLSRARFTLFDFFKMFVWGIRAFRQWLDRMGVGKAM